MSVHYGGSHFASTHYASSHYGRGIVDVVITPGGGIHDWEPLKQTRRRRQEEMDFMALLVAVVEVIERE